MNVLITNNRLDARAGTECFVRDLARGLQSRGHRVMAYSSDPGRLPRLTENDEIPVVTDLASLPVKPDIIHAQHHLDAMTALLALPGVPAVYHCHGAVWQECPPLHPRILRYLAMSKTLAERIVTESGIDPTALTVMLNFVDLSRFRNVRQLPDRPLRALIYNSFHHEHTRTVQAIREACGQCGLQLDVIGIGFGVTIEKPEDVLPGYDLVFASGKSAIESIACGCAVIVLGRSSCGPMVDLAVYERLRSVNFSIAANSTPVPAEVVRSEIARFSNAGAADVSERLRSEAGLEKWMDDLMPVYEDVIEKNRMANVADLRGELVAVSDYLRWLVPMIKAADALKGGAWDREHYEEMLAGLQNQLLQVTSERDRLTLEKHAAMELIKLLESRLKETDARLEKSEARLKKADGKLEKSEVRRTAVLEKLEAMKTKKRKTLMERLFGKKT